MIGHFVQSIILYIVDGDFVPVVDKIVLGIQSIKISHKCVEIKTHSCTNVFFVVRKYSN